MNEALSKLVYYFGYIGIASIVAWMAAAALAALFVLGWRRSKVCFAALTLAVVALILANVNSNYVSAIKIDFSVQLLEARERAQRQAEAEEDEPSEESDVSAAAQQAKRDEAAEKGVGDQPQYSYRQEGKAERDEGMEVEEKIPIGPPAEDQDVDLNVRTMTMPDVVRANQLDRLNLLLAKCMLCLALLLVVVDYFRRFNKTFESYLPLPLGGWLIDSLFPKSHTVLARVDKARRWKQFLEGTVRKGETFLYFSREDPWPAAPLRRFPPLVPLPWALEKITCTGGEADFDDEFLFESAWFGRYCFVLVGDGPSAAARLESLADFLELRRETRAAAAHTVNVLWDPSTPVPRSTLGRLLPLCRETNFKLILATASLPDEELAGRFEDVVV